ncbi:MAG: MmgE/PrpD family protein, partial [Roseibium sp.]|uniref:MmgE/PrpD family protein n=1 Tax=Roseibium sp. TaxID=1936156 RepID=UPI002615A78D
MTPPIARRFAQFAVSRTSFPDEVSEVADRALLDTIGAIIAGGAHDATRRVHAAMPKHPGPATLATGGTCDVETASLVNGMAAHVWDIDDTSYTGIMHGSAVIVPAVLAIAQEVGASAELQRRAFIIGSEITYTLADVCTHDHYFHGWWSTVTFSLT